MLALRSLTVLAIAALADGLRLQAPCAVPLAVCARSSAPAVMCAPDADAAKMAAAKRVVRAATAHPDLEGHLRYELHNIRRAFDSADGREARQAFLDKRDPTFEGR